MFAWKTVESLEEASWRPSAVRRLWLLGRGCPFEECSALLPQLTGLREFHIGWQSWTELPPELGDLRKLRTVTALNMPIAVFPAFLVRCPRLSSLTLRGTDITVLPEVVREFRRLRRLDFSNNHLRVVPEWLGDLVELTELALADNLLCTLPESLENLRRLRHLGLAGNQFTSAEAGRIRNWFRDGVAGVWGRDEIRRRSSQV
jgi:Leucine-rich repeat (LRR) protein